MSKIFLTPWGLNGIPTYAFGDGINDLALFEACDYGIAMGNAREELKRKKATFISTKKILRMALLMA